MKVKLITKCGTETIVNMDKSVQLYPHFKLSELANTKGKTDLPQMVLSPDVDEFLSMIEEFRAWWGKGMHCNSCYRQPEFNASVGGSSRSLHLSALAFDWGVTLTYEQRVAVYRAWAAICKRRGRIGGINFYPWGCHLDAFEDRLGNTSFVIRDGNKRVSTVPRP